VSNKYETLAAALGKMADAEVASLNALLSASTGEPQAPGSGLIYADDFTGYASTADLLNYQPTKGFLHMDVENGVTLDPTGGVGGKPACKIAWTPKSGAGNCVDDSHLIERVFPATTAVCASWTVRYSPAFVFDWLGLKGCVGNAKKLFFFWPVAGSRFDCICENHHIGIGSDNDHPLFAQTAPEVTPEMLGDGARHRITVRVKQSSTVTAADGHIEGWIDGVKKWDVANWVSASSGGYNDWKMPTTFNQGSPVSQTEWLNSVSIWRP
jgi:hypothetical protein